MQFGVNDSTRQLYIVIDLLVSASVLFVFLRFCNTPRLFKYLGVLLLALAALVITANYILPSLHFISQAAIILLLVGLPFVAEDKLKTLFRPDSVGDTGAFSPNAPTVHPLILIVVALLGSVLLTGLSSGPGFKTAELPQGVAVSAANLPEGISANFGSQKRIQVIVRAPRSVWSTLDANDFSATIDVKGLPEGTHEASVVVSSKLNDVKILNTKPTRVTVTLEPVIRKTVVVVARFSGKANDDLVPDDPIFEPDKVEISGPKSIVSDVTQAVAQISLDGQSQKIDQKYSLVALTSGGSAIEDVSFTPAEVVAKVALVKAGKLKTVGIRVKTSGQPASGFWISEVTATPSTVLVTASADVLDKLTVVDTDAVSVTGLNKETDVSIGLAFPAGVVAADSTSKVTVKLKVSETTSTKAVTPTISYEGVDASLKVTNISPTSVAAIVSATTALLSGLTGNDVQLKLNLSAYKTAGTYAVTIPNSFFVLKEGVTLVSFLPSTINVTLEVK